MKKLLIILLTLSFAALPVIAQSIIFSDDFESGSVDAGWGLYRAGEEPLSAVPMTSAPVALGNGGSYVGYLHDADNSYTGAGIALAGEESLDNYTIEADVYCYVNHSEGSAYTGLVVYADSTIGTYEKLVADFDGNDRFRLYNNHLNMTTFQYTFHAEISASGLYTTDAWHHMKLTVNTVNDSTTEFSCYFDGTLIGDEIYTDDGVDQMDSGKFGLFSFQMGGNEDGLPGYFDNVVVTTNAVSIEPKDNLQPGTFMLLQNYPNPFNPSTTIEFVMEEAGPVNLSIYDISGKVVRTLANGVLAPGRKTLKWDATDNSGNIVAPGVYFYSLRTSDFSETKKMMLIK